MTVYERTELSNGIRVLTAPMPHAQSTSCLLMFAAGSRYEQKAANGIAHFAEHMFFKGTERRPTSRDITTEIDSIGGEFNAFTGKEYTGYYVKCAAEHRDVVAWRVVVHVHLLDDHALLALDLLRLELRVAEHVDEDVECRRPLLGRASSSTRSRPTRRTCASACARTRSRTRTATRSNC